MSRSTSFDNLFDKLDRPQRRNGVRRAPKRKVRRRPAAKNAAAAAPEEEVLPAVGTMARTKRLVLAALRVWELKRGIRD